MRAGASFRILRRVGLAAVVVAAFVVTPTVAIASAGLRVEEIACCCADPSECKCFDHDDEPHSDAHLDPCGHEGELVPLVAVIAALPAPPLPLCTPRAVTAPPPRSVPMPDDRTSRPVTPPF